MPRGVYKRTKEYLSKLKTIGFQKGHKGFVPPESYKIISEKTKERMSKYKGKTPLWLEKYSFTLTRHKIAQGEKHPLFKKSGAHKTSIHQWIYRRYGFPTKCEHCGFESEKHTRVQWANIDHKYSRKIEDWMRLCVPCHRKYDYKNNKNKDELYKRGGNFGSL